MISFLFQDMQQTQPIFEQDDVQKTYSPFDDKHVKEAKKELPEPAQQVEPSKATVPAVEVQKEEVKKDDPETQEKAGFWKKFGDKAKGIFG